MPYNTQPLITDANGKPIPQYFDPVADAYRPLAQTREQIISSTTVLAASATFTSAVVDAKNFGRITGVATSNVAGTLELHESVDGTSFHKTATISVAAGAVVRFDEKVSLRHIQLKYVNGATAQTSFALAAYSTIN